MIAVATGGRSGGKSTCVVVIGGLMRLWGWPTATLVSRCPEAAERAAMDDGAFWERVRDSLLAPGADPFADWADGEDLDDLDFLPDRLGQPCPVCHERGACGFDLEGRALIHALEDEGEV